MIEHTPEHSYQKRTLFGRPDRLDKSPLYVVTPVINAHRFRTRWKLYENFQKHVAESGAILYTIEVAFGDRDFVVTQPDNPRHIQIRTLHEIWGKEAAINLAVQRLPPGWQFVSWIDADCMFTRQDWADEAKHLLQHYPIIQMWSQLCDLNSEMEAIDQLRSFMDVQLNGPTKPHPNDQYPCGRFGVGQKFGSPGLAWACRRETWNMMGGLIDYCILGAGDWYFANAIMGTLDKAIKGRNDITGPFCRKMLEYQEHLRRARWEERPIVGNAGLLKGLTIHYWHGPRSNRGYGSRGEILTRNQFDPDRDLKRDSQGFPQLVDRNPQLRRDIQRYFASRNEDQL